MRLHATEPVVIELEVTEGLDEIAVLQLLAGQPGVKSAVLMEYDGSGKAREGAE